MNTWCVNILSCAHSSHESLKNVTYWRTEGPFQNVGSGLSGPHQASVRPGATGLLTGLSSIDWTPCEISIHMLRVEWSEVHGIIQKQIPRKTIAKRSVDFRKNFFANPKKTLCADPSSSISPQSTCFVTVVSESTGIFPILPRRINVCRWNCPVFLASVSSYSKVVWVVVNQFGLYGYRCHERGIWTRERFLLRGTQQKPCKTSHPHGHLDKFFLKSYDSPEDQSINLASNWSHTLIYPRFQKYRLPRL